MKNLLKKKNQGHKGNILLTALFAVFIGGVCVLMVPFHNYLTYAHKLDVTAQTAASDAMRYYSDHVGSASYEEALSRVNKIVESALPKEKYNVTAELTFGKLGQDMTTYQASVDDWKNINAAHVVISSSPFSEGLLENIKSSGESTAAKCNIMGQQSSDSIQFGGTCPETCGNGLPDPGEACDYRIPETRLYCDANPYIRECQPCALGASQCAALAAAGRIYTDCDANKQSCNPPTKTGPEYNDTKKPMYYCSTSCNVATSHYCGDGNVDKDGIWKNPSTNQNFESCDRGTEPYVAGGKNKKWVCTDTMNNGMERVFDAIPYYHKSTCMRLEQCTFCSADCALDESNKDQVYSVGCCGDGFVNGPEKCDVGGAGRPAVFSQDFIQDLKMSNPVLTEEELSSKLVCQPGCGLPEPECGNGVVEDKEDCDYAAPNAPSNCNSSCRFDHGGPQPICGDNQVNRPGEECDGDDFRNPLQALPGAYLVCKGNCTLPDPVCGNGVVEDKEDCDDWNTQNGDGCSSACKNEAKTWCGDGKKNVDENGDKEDCDYNDPAAPANCNHQCKLDPDNVLNCANGEVTFNRSVRVHPWNAQTVIYADQASADEYCRSGGHDIAYEKAARFQHKSLNDMWDYLQYTPPYPGMGILWAPGQGMKKFDGSKWVFIGRPMEEHGIDDIECTGGVSTKRPCCVGANGSYYGTITTAEFQNPVSPGQPGTGWYAGNYYVARYQDADKICMERGYTAAVTFSKTYPDSPILLWALENGSWTTVPKTTDPYITYLKCYKKPEC